MDHTWPYRSYLAKASGKDEDHDRGVGKNSGIARMTFRKAVAPKKDGLLVMFH